MKAIHQMISYFYEKGMLSEEQCRHLRDNGYVPDGLLPLSAFGDSEPVLAAPDSVATTLTIEMLRNAYKEVTEISGLGRGAIRSYYDAERQIIVTERVSELENGHE